MNIDDIEDDLDLVDTEDDQDDQEELPSDDDAESGGEADVEEEPEYDEIGFDDESDQPDDTALQKHLRDVIRRKDKELAELRSGKTSEPVEVGEEPGSLEDFDYDEGKHSAAWRDYSNRCADAARQQSSADTNATRAEQSWREDVGRFEARREALRAPDRDEILETVGGSLSQVQVATLIKAAADPATFMYALGRSPAKLAAIAAIDDPIKMAAEVARMERNVKVASTRKAPPPERIATGGKPNISGGDKVLAKLEKEAERTGDRSAVIAHKRKMRERA